MADGHRQVSLERTATGTYVARNAAGVEIELGSGEGMFSPVELLLAAIGGCTAIDVDVVTARRSTAERFGITVGAQRIVDELGGSRLQDVEVVFDVAFPDDEQGQQAQRMVPRLVQLSHDKDCTVSRTVEFPTRVTSRLADADPA